jgi:hypothetical protein
MTQWMEIACLVNGISLIGMVDGASMTEMKLVDGLVQLYSKLRGCVKRKHLSLSTGVPSHIELRAPTDR